MPNLRTTRQVVEVLGDPAPKFRATRQVVEVVYQVEGTPAENTLTMTSVATVVWSKSFSAENTLALNHGVNYVGPHWVSAASQIILDQSVSSPQVFTVSAESALALTQSTTPGGTRRVSAESVITFNQYADNAVKTRSVSNTLVLSQSATVDKILKAESVLSLSQSVSLGEIRVSAENTLDLVQTGRIEPQPQFASSQIELTQTTRTNLRHVSAENTLELSQSAGVSKPIRVSAESELIVTTLVYDPELIDFVEVQSGLDQAASFVSTRAKDTETTYLQTTQHVDVVHIKASGVSLSAQNTLTLSQDAHLTLTGDAESQLTLSQVAIGEIGRPIGNTIELTQSAVVSVIRDIGSSSTLGITQAVSYTLVLASTRCQYSPFVGSSSDPDAPEPPPTSLQGPMVGIQVPFQLVYPSVGAVTDSVALKTPNLGNRDRLTFHRVQRETRGGTLVIFADPIWPKVETLVLTFSGLLRVEAHELLVFIEAHLGQEIGLIDWEHRYWKGVITTPEEPIIEDRFDSFTVNITFEGELDPSWNPQVVPPSLRYSATRTPQQDGYYVPNEPIPPVVGEAMDYNEAEADATIKIGYPLYLTGAAHVNPAQADAAGTTQVAGISIADVSAGASCKYLTEGRVERSDWTEVAGTTLLSPGVTYFLDPASAGHITTTAPTTIGQYVVRVGRAIDTTTLDIEIGLPILL